jgi:uncharacterized DUF497 family protein
MISISFVWDRTKAESNLKKHKISFEEAVCHCYIEDDMVIRIISARKANKNEQKQYGSFLL